MKYRAIAQQLEKKNLCVWPNFLSPELLGELHGDMNLIQKEDGFHRAGTGQNEGNDLRDQVRRDEVHWLDRKISTPVQEVLLNKLDLLMQALNRTLYLGLAEFNGHYAAYPKGGFYKRHLDCFQKDQSRVVSVILFLNKNWSVFDGGELRVYDATSYTDVEPVGGTLVCFFSNESEHEVLTSYANRFSFTGWFSR